MESNLPGWWIPTDTRTPWEFHDGIFRGGPLDGVEYRLCGAGQHRTWFQLCSEVECELQAFKMRIDPVLFHCSRPFVQASFGVSQACYDPATIDSLRIFDPQVTLIMENQPRVAGLDSFVLAQGRLDDALFIFPVISRCRNEDNQLSNVLDNSKGERRGA